MPNRKETDSTVIRTRDLLYRDLEFQSEKDTHRVPGTGCRRRVEIRCNERLSSSVSFRPHARNPVGAVGMADDVVVTRFSTLEEKDMHCNASSFPGSGKRRQP
jgi:hypothetical protein